MNVPDNKSICDTYEREQARLERSLKKQVLEFETVPDDYGQHKKCYPNYKEEE